MGARHSGREAALQMLFQMEASGASVDRVVELFWRNFEADPEGRSYADEVVRGIADALDKVDKRITQASAHWRLERMARVDRNVLRLGAWELENKLDVPRAVILDEAVELAKSYGTEDSSSFVNGVLDKVAESLGRVDTDR
jgi:transcription antitermination protein NusB